MYNEFVCQGKIPRSRHGASIYFCLSFKNQKKKWTFSLLVLIVMLYHEKKLLFSDRLLGYS